MTLHLGKHHGVNMRRMPDANGRIWLCFTIWYRAGKNRLGYLYPSFRWF